MPADAPAIKLEHTRADGAEVRLYDRERESREAIGAAIAADTGAVLIRPYDDPDVIAGQGTVGLELAEQARAAGAIPDAALIPCGGGGLIAGCSLALTELCPGIEIFAVEPAAFDDTRRSLAAGARLSNPAGGRSICDALLAPCPGELTFALNRRLLAGGLAVSDAEVRRALGFAFRHLKLVVEPGGAVALAALLAGALEVRGRTVAVVLSGGNVDPAAFAQALRQSGRGLSRAAMAIADARKGLSHLFVHDLVLAARIGVHPHEQQTAQRVRLNLDLGVVDGGRMPDGLAAVVDYEALTERVRRLVQGAHVALVEQLAERLARLCLEDPRVRRARVRVEKLEAIADCAAVGVEIERLNPRRYEVASAPARG